MTICPRCGRGEDIQKYKREIKRLENVIDSSLKRIKYLEGEEFYNSIKERSFSDKRRR